MKIRINYYKLFCSILHKCIIDILHLINRSYNIFVINLQFNLFQNLYDISQT